MIKIGDNVKLKKRATKLSQSDIKNYRTAKVVKFCPDISKGAVRLDRHIGGFRFWNIADLEKA